MGIVRSPRDFNKLEVGKRIKSKKNDNRGIVLDLTSVKGKIVVSYCIDGSNDVYTLNERQFNKDFSILSKTEEAGLNYFFNNLPTELVNMSCQSNENEASTYQVDIDPVENGWDPFDDFNFS